MRSSWNKSVAPGLVVSTTIIRYLGGPTALIEFGGVRLLTDPTFDASGGYPIGQSKLMKTAGRAVSAEGLGDVAAVPFSHDQHPDKLDTAGRAYATQAPLVMATPSAQERLGGPVRALYYWASYELADGVRVTGVPARHGPVSSEGLAGRSLPHPDQIRCSGGSTTPRRPARDMWVVIGAAAQFPTLIHTSTLVVVVGFWLLVLLDRADPFGCDLADTNARHPTGREELR